MSGDGFQASARAVYERVNAATMEWVLDRPLLAGGFINTKMHSIERRDYTAADGVRGPAYLYGWIQGRGLEAIVSHAEFFERAQPHLAQKLDAFGRRLYRSLLDLCSTDGHVYFCYRNGHPVIVAGDREIGDQTRPPDIYTFSDAFAAKGLVAAAVRYQDPGLEDRLWYLRRVVAAIEENRFQIDESALLSEAATGAQGDDYGTRMILLGAAPLLSQLGLPEEAAFAPRFIDHVLNRHLDPQSNLLRNLPDGDACSIGHACEFAGFALDYLGSDADKDLIRTLGMILEASVRVGFVGTGLALTASVSARAPVNRRSPWWSLPEAIRAASLAHKHTGDERYLDVWRRCHAAFFAHFWSWTPPVAYQSLLDGKPVDVVPATPDLDPGYHTGLSLLAAIRAADAAAVTPAS